MPSNIKWRASQIVPYIFIETIQNHRRFEVLKAIKCIYASSDHQPYQYGIYFLCFGDRSIILTIEAETASETLEIRSISTWLIAGEDRITLDTVRKKWLLVTVANNKSIHNHQFGFRQRHSTTVQTHSVIQKINQAFDSNQ
jgi:hypothetical protein